MTNQEKALRVLNAGENACKVMLKQLKAIEKELGKTRLDFVNVRTMLYGPGKGKTGRTNGELKK